MLLQLGAQLRLLLLNAADPASRAQGSLPVLLLYLGHLRSSKVFREQWEPIIFSVISQLGTRYILGNLVETRWNLTVDPSLSRQPFICPTAAPFLEPYQTAQALLLQTLHAGNISILCQVFCALACFYVTRMPCTGVLHSKGMIFSAPQHPKILKVQLSVKLTWRSLPANLESPAISKDLWGLKDVGYCLGAYASHCVGGLHCLSVLYGLYLQCYYITILRGVWVPSVTCRGEALLVCMGLLLLLSLDLAIICCDAAWKLVFLSASSVLRLVNSYFLRFSVFGCAQSVDWVVGLVGVRRVERAGCLVVLLSSTIIGLLCQGDHLGKLPQSLLCVGVSRIQCVY